MADRSTTIHANGEPNAGDAPSSSAPPASGGSNGGGGEELNISEKTKKECQAKITQKLVTLVGENGVEILTEYVWHMITRPRATKEHVIAELDEFLGQQAPAFVEWVIATVGPAINQEIIANRQHAAATAVTVIPSATPPPGAAAPRGPQTREISIPSVSPADQPPGRRILNMAVRQAAQSSAIPPATTMTDGPTSIPQPPVATYHPTGRMRRVQMAADATVLPQAAPATQPQYPGTSAAYRPARGPSPTGPPSGGGARRRRVSPYREHGPAGAEAVPEGIPSQSPGGIPGAGLPLQSPPPPPPPGQQVVPGSITSIAGIPPGGMVGNVVIDPTTGQALQLVPLGSRGAEAPSIRKVRKRCAKFPNCPFGDECRYIHPSEMCVNWPHCTFGSECFYIHPEVPCKYGVNCLNAYCNYVHPPERDLEAGQRRYNPYTGTYRNPTLVNTGGGRTKAEVINEHAGSKVPMSKPEPMDPDFAVQESSSSTDQSQLPSGTYGNQEAMLGAIKADEEAAVTATPIGDYHLGNGDGMTDADAPSTVTPGQGPAQAPTDGMR